MYCTPQEAQLKRKQQGRHLENMENCCVALFDLQKKELSNDSAAGISTHRIPQNIAPSLATHLNTARNTSDLKMHRFFDHDCRRNHCPCLCTSVYIRQKVPLQESEVSFVAAVVANLIYAEEMQATFATQHLALRSWQDRCKREWMQLCCSLESETYKGPAISDAGLHCFSHITAPAVICLPIGQGSPVLHSNWEG